ncbi:hypothetical protein LCGC14_0889870 [marine sediment metagenome]|uniref:Uncharacterized protein n=1 Tax=marine sediment metagenome TaxID=412755 RepID=A0A0F9P4E3_9ZZZZ
MRQSRIQYRDHLYREADLQGQRAGRRQLVEFRRGRLTNQMWLAKKQKDIWRWSGDLVGSIDQQGNVPDKASWHPLTGEVVLTHRANHGDDIMLYGTQPEHQYLRLQVRRNGQINIIPWNPIWDDVDYDDLHLLEAEIQQACYVVAEHFQDLLEPTLPPEFFLNLRGCSEKY